ncbi:hypothetical protein NHX12_023401 [Muraenolepis orangiensis]|uniref:AGRL2-4 GAIN subdomain A domain-containing protein n=1 Tax=Muraenolepis orangiensis TaxID=630683 RepID=A0A9Q0EL05_9TELE|nr:hypothetical protein NHX12_023401 [Muraenolepis orangiensis]
MVNPSDVTPGEGGTQRQREQTAGGPGAFMKRRPRSSKDRDPSEVELKVKTQRQRSADQPGVFQAQTGDPAAEEWSQWSECSLTCGQGWQVRTRSCVSSPYGTLCSGALRETRIRCCMLDTNGVAFWGPPSFARCVSLEYRSLHVSREHLAKGQRTLAGEGMSQIVRSLLELLQRRSFHSGDLLFSTHILRNVTDTFKRATYIPAPDDRFFQVVSFLLDMENVEQWEDVHQGAWQRVPGPRCLRVKRRQESRTSELFQPVENVYVVQPSCLVSQHRTSTRGRKDNPSKEAYELAFGRVREHRVPMAVIDEASLHGDEDEGLPQGVVPQATRPLAASAP